MRIGGRSLRAVILGILCVGAAATARAQTPPQPSRPTPAQSEPTRGAGWEIEGYGGLSITRLPAGGTSSLPRPGPAITTSSPIFPSRQVPSYFFGDGTTLLNGVNAEFEVPQRITPLEAILTSIGRDQTSGAAFGLRVRRGLRPRWAAEFSVDLLTGSAVLTDDVRDGIADTRASYEAAFLALFETGPLTSPRVSATATVSDGSRLDIAATGALVLRAGSIGGLEPYLTMGGGILAGAGPAPSATLEGAYSFSVLGEVPIAETDRVTVRFSHETKPVGVLGGGVRRRVTDRWGFSIDGRVFIGRGGTGVRIDAQPTVTTGAPPGFIESFTTPSIQFSNDVSTGRQSTLSGTALDDFPLFRGRGIQTRVLVTVGVFTRF
jgi:hypothetical protein